MKRLLWVTALPPAFSAGGGGQIRQAHLLDGLAEHFEVSLLVAGELTDARLRGRLASVHEVPVTLAGDPPQRWRRRLRDLWWLGVRRESDEIARHRQVRHVLAPRAAAAGAEVVCVEYVGLAPILPRTRQGLWTLTLHNLTSVMARHNAAIAPGRRQRAMLALEERHARRVEHWAVSAYDLVTVVSADDARELPPGVAIVPNGVDAGRLRPTPIPAAAGVVFTGALHTLPNRDGIAWFCSDVWPLIRSAVPAATLAIVGAAPPEEVRALAAQPGVSVHADVPDVAPFLEQARVAVVPLRVGTGSRLKALEAMAAGRPVVGTAIGLGGLDLSHERDALVADEPGAFAAAVVRCLTDVTLADALGHQARRTAEGFAWAKIAAAYAELLDERSG